VLVIEALGEKYMDELNCLHKKKGEQ